MGKRASMPAHLSDVEILPRETAEENNTPRQLSEAEHQAIVADRVDRETAEIRARVDTLTATNSDLQGKLDVAETARQTAEQAKDAAEKALDDYKAQVESDRQIAERKDERAKKVREVAAQLKDDFYTAERVERWARMDDAAFEDYVKEIAAVSTGATPAKDSPKGDAPRETAMHGTPVTPNDEGRGNATNVLSMRRNAKGA